MRGLELISQLKLSLVGAMVHTISVTELVEKYPVCMYELVVLPKSVVLGNCSGKPPEKLARSRLSAVLVCQRANGLRSKVSPRNSSVTWLSTLQCSAGQSSERSRERK